MFRVNTAAQGVIFSSLKSINTQSLQKLFTLYLLGLFQQVLKVGLLFFFKSSEIWKQLPKLDVMEFGKRIH